MKLYEFTQNNSGGYFEVDDKVCHRVFIEADNAMEANEIAQELGIYFDGCDKGIDCPCCGDRWYEVWDNEYVDLDVINKRGWEVQTYGEENNWYEKYGQYEIVESPICVGTDKLIGNLFQGKIKFRNVEEYVQFLANEYGWTSPDARIYYKDGTVKEIFIQK